MIHQVVLLDVLVWSEWEELGQYSPRPSSGERPLRDACGEVWSDWYRCSMYGGMR